MKPLLLACMFGLICCAALAQDVIILGEVHDNPTHHALQAKRVGALEPAALVFEMLTPGQAEHVTPELRKDQVALEAALQWGKSGWPDFAMYYPIFAAAPDAKVMGAHLPRAKARAAMQEGAAAVFGENADDYGLLTPLAPGQQVEREALQMAAHCDALPPEMLPGMVDIQRLRDAMLARAVVTAWSQVGGPVVVITGNGHARRDWGVPAVLAHAMPKLEVVVVGQTEDDQPLEGGFDEVLSAPAVDRPDPCAAFR